MLNGNNVPWSVIVRLTERMTKLDELHLSANNLGNPGNIVIEVIYKNIFKHFVKIFLLEQELETHFPLLQSNR